MAAHRYWRVYVSATNGSSITGVRELEFRTTSGGADVTGAGQGTAFASSIASGSFVAANAVVNAAGIDPYFANQASARARSPVAS